MHAHWEEGSRYLASEVCSRMLPYPVLVGAVVQADVVLLNSWYQYTYVHHVPMMLLKRHVLVINYNVHARIDL